MSASIRSGSDVSDSIYSGIIHEANVYLAGLQMRYGALTILDPLLLLQRKTLNQRTKGLLKLTQIVMVRVGPECPDSNFQLLLLFPRENLLHLGDEVQGTAMTPSVLTLLSGTCKLMHFAEPCCTCWTYPHSSGFLNMPPR